MTTSTKDTVYVDVDDEITAVIEKVIKSKHKIVALVLPKKATVFQSTVNQKLLQRAAKSAKKNLVLVTSDNNVLSVAAAAGLMIAKTPTSKPSIPVVDGEMADSEAAGSDDVIELDNGKAATDVVVATEAATAAVAKKSNSKKLLKIPDFSSFRLRLGLGIGAVIALIVLWYVGFVVMPKATITIKTDVSTIAVNTTVKATVGGVELDLEGNILPAERVQTEKIDSVTVEATGEKNIGQKATGTMTLTNCIKDDEQKVVAPGTTFSKDSVSFITSEQIILGPAVYVGNNCISADFPGLGAQGDVAVEAAQPGSEYNVSSGSFTSSISGISAFGSDMTGGTSETVKVVSQEDVDSATQKLSGTSKNAAQDELNKQLIEKGLRPIDESIGEGTPKVVAAPGIGQEAAETKVTMTVAYNLLGAKDEDISAILDNEIEKSLGDRQQNVRDNGLSTVKFAKLDSPDEAVTIMSMDTVAETGPDIDPEQVKSDVVGKKRGEIEKQLESIEGVRSVSVEYSPAWITTTPKSTSKITVIFVEEDDGQ